MIDLISTLMVVGGIEVIGLMFKIPYWFFKYGAIMVYYTMKYTCIAMCYVVKIIIWIIKEICLLTTK